MKNNLIGIAGKIGSGKDTVGNILQYLAAEKYWGDEWNMSYKDFLKTL